MEPGGLVLPGIRVCYGCVVCGYYGLTSGWSVCLALAWIVVLALDGFGGVWVFWVS